jgi:phosphoserine phosphatase
MRFSLAAFDFDGTLTVGETSWQMLHSAFGTKQVSKQNQELFKKGKISYAEWAKMDVALWKGKTFEECLRISRNMRLVPGSVKLFKTLRNRGVTTAIVSAGLNIFVDNAQKTLHADYVYCNKLVTRNGVLTGEIEVVVDYEKKEKIISELTSRLGFSRNRVVVIGDGDSDLAMFKAAGHSVAFNPSYAKLLPLAHTVVLGDMSTFYNSPQNFFALQKNFKSCDGHRKQDTGINEQAVFSVSKANAIHVGGSH